MRAPAPLRSPRTHIVRAAAARSAPAPGANAGRARHAGGASATAVETSPRRRSDARLSAAGSPGRWRTGGDRSIRWSSLFVSFFPPERRGKNKTKQNNKPEPKPNAKQRYSTANFRRPPQDAHPARGHLSHPQSRGPYFSAGPVSHPKGGGAPGGPELGSAGR